MNKRLFYIFFKRAIATMMVLTYMTSGISPNIVNAYSKAECQSSKISSELERYIETADDNTIIPVWIWFEDINQESPLRSVEDKCGLSLDDIDLSYESFSNDFVYNSKVDEKVNSDNIERYLLETKEQRKDEKSLTREYLSTKRSILSDAYTKQNEEYINKLKIDKEDILFKSSLTPSAIAYLSIDEIKTISGSSNVTHIDYYDDSNEAAPPTVNTRDGERAAMRADDVQEITGLNGDGVNVIVFDHGWVRPEANLFENVDISKVHTVYNEQIYSAADSSNLSDDWINESHPNLVASTIQQFASEVNIYSVGYKQYGDVEWAIQNCDIDIINGSINIATYYNYNDDSPAKWLDAIVNTYNIPFVASAGNDCGWQPEGWPNVISPSSGYNSIAVGAYNFNANPNRMHDYRFNQIDSTEQVNYKPDIVVASPSTSEASPMVTGIIAMMIQLKPSLSANPELIKAILMASCHRKVEPAYNAPAEYIVDGLTQRQGAGAIDAYNAISIVTHETYGIGNISSGTLNVKNIPSPVTGANMNVSLAWLNQNTNTTYNNTTIGVLKELELEITDSNNSIIKYSDKKNTCKQMVYFPVLNDEDEYTIRIKKVSSDNENTRFAYAWSTDEETNSDLINKSIFINNALSGNHTVSVDTPIDFKKIIYNGTITQYKLLGLISEFDCTNVSVDGENVIEFSNIHPLTFVENYTGTYELDNGYLIKYKINNCDDGVYITLYDSMSGSIVINDNANIVDHYIVETHNGAKTYTNSALVSLAEPISIKFYDSNNVMIDTLVSTSFNEITALSRSNDATYKITSGYEDNMPVITLSTYIMGDVNMNGILDEEDSATLMRYIVSYYNFVQTGSTGDLNLGNGNLTINGDISANGTFTIDAVNANINGQLSATNFVNNITGNLNMNKPMNNITLTDEYVKTAFSDERMNAMFFKTDNTNIILGDYNVNDVNITVFDNTSVNGDISLNGNVNINSNLKADGDIEIIGNVENTVKGVIYSKSGNITLDSNNVNFNGFIYAPNGTVTITGSNLTIKGTIIAENLIIEGNTVNFNVAAIDEGYSGGEGFGDITLTEFQLMIGDVNYDSHTNIQDVVIINKRRHELTS